MRGRTVSAITLARLIEDADLGKGPLGAVREPPLPRQLQRAFPFPWREGVRGRGTRSISTLALPHPERGKSRGVAAVLGFGLVMTCLICAPHHLNAAQITDDRGAAVTVAAPPQRIVSLYGGLTEILSALGVGNRVVARIQGDETIQDIPTVGTHLQPNVEMILALKPDLVVQGGVAKGMPALARLEAAQVPVAMFAPRDFAGLFSTITRLGALTGRVEAAAALARSMEAKLAGVAGRVANRPRPRVFFEVRELNLLAAGQGSLVNDIITRAGGENLVTSPQKLTLYSLEALIQANPEVYIIQQGPMNRSPEDIYTRPYFQELKAVKARRVLVVSESLFSRPGPRSAEAVEQLARFLHPEAWEKQGAGDRDQKKIN
jgi:iron complex transport system substrate-binding protein